MPTLRTITLGCKVNQYETEYLRQGFLHLGYRDAEPDDPVDLVIFNTCTVTHQADAECRKILRRLAREHPEAEIIVMGCFAAKAADEIAAMPGVSEVLTDKRQMRDCLARRGLVDVPTGISFFARRHRAYVKVQDGCVLPCTYCIIPQVRPGLWSRPVEDILLEVRQLVDNGYREVVLTGVHLGLFGRGPNDDRSVDLAELVSRLLGVDDRFRIRLSSLEVNEVSDRLLELMAENGHRICPHLHIPLQSGSPKILKRMRRRADVEYYLRRCERVKQALYYPAITTDIMVGFPGETDTDFEETCQVVETVGFAKIHIFRFSPREGTPAAEYPDQVPEHVKKERSAHLDRLAQQVRRRYIGELIGSRLQVLWEDLVTDPAGRPQAVLGMSDRYIPVRAPANLGELGELGQVDVCGFDGEFLLVGGQDCSTTLAVLNVTAD
ncbi:tRNA (N(6)-L-threonylcarbamoyladenosine(37)-C(2))-methylthiotransferase MtaB [Thermogutta sp.]|uniref:tRNA (N(6)-L-threonylcarbamoyladenosine(37)-C(2))- methylthiotransferase MtaB n=1 Tax=Thermogutta sp. TaxID=1962930 RepID=UPI00321FFE27